VPVERGTSATRLGAALAEVAVRHLGPRLVLRRAEGDGVAEAARLATELRAVVSRGDVALVTLDPVVDNPAGLGVANVVDAVLLAVHLGTTTRATLRRTLELVGRERIVGTVALRRGR
jgi:hypothetical protein